MTKDNISVTVDAVVFVKIVNTKDSIVNIRNVWDSVMKYSQTTMRDVVGDVELDELLARRDEVADKIANIVDRETAEWGVDIISVKLQTVELPGDMKRVIARQAEAEREKRAVIIKSEGELTAAENLERAVNKMSNRAMYLRTLSSLEDISFDQSNTIVFACTPGHGQRRNHRAIRFCWSKQGSENDAKNQKQRRIKKKKREF